MDAISPEMLKEIEARVADGPFGSADELLRFALRALDRDRGVAQAMLEKELLHGLEGGDVEMTSEDWIGIRHLAERHSNGNSCDI